MFEVGDVIVSGHNRKRLAAVAMHSKASFTEAKSLAEGILRDLDVKFELKECEHNSFIRGRIARAVNGDEQIGFFGEIHPRVISNFDLKYPIIACEFIVEKLR